MSRKKRDRKRVRGSDGKLYDSKKQKDNGHRAHESRAETAVRRTRWKSRGAARSAAGAASRFCGGLLDAFIWIVLALFIRPAGKLLHIVWIGFNRVAGKIGAMAGRSSSRSSGSRGRN